MPEPSTPEPAEAGSFVFVDLDGRVAVYDRRSNLTHLLDPLSAEILCVVAAEPDLAGRAGAVHEHLDSGQVTSTDTVSESQVAEALDHLRRVGLVG